MTEANRRNARKIYAGTLPIGGDAPISVQSMTNTPPHDLAACLAQVKALASAGCQLVRMTVPDREAVRVFAKVREEVEVPLCADIHFDYKMAIEAAAAGADKIRINPGNIGGNDRVKAVVEACRKRNIPIRIGVNGGSLEKEVLAQYGRATPEAMVESAARHVALLEALDFYDICISLKASDPARTIAANRMAAERFPYPLHLGVTEAGRGQSARLKSAVGIGALLAMGIGDTIRVSMTGDPVQEVAAGFEILKAAGRQTRGVNFVSCPTCGRCGVDLENIARSVEEKLSGVETDRVITVAIMGCAVNGPGEASSADVGIAAGKGEVLLFKQGKVLGKVPEEKAADALYSEVMAILRGDRE